MSPYFLWNVQVQQKIEEVERQPGDCEDDHHGTEQPGHIGQGWEILTIIHNYTFVPFGIYIG